MKHHQDFKLSALKRRMPVLFLLTVLLLSVSLKGYGQLTANFSANTTSICRGSTVEFTNISTGTTGATSYDWDFGAGASPATATGEGPHTVTYNVPGTSTVSLAITDGVSDSETKPDYITITAFPSNPTANLTQPTCVVSTGSIDVTSPTGVNIQYSIDGANWVSTTTFSNLAPDVTYTIRVRDNSVNPSCISSSDFTINAQPPTPAVPTQTVDCALGVGQGVVNVIGPLGAQYEYSLDGGAYQTGTSFSNVANGSHYITVRNSEGCTNQGSNFDVNCGCVNGPTVTLSASSGSTCGTQVVTVSGNTFGGSATSVTITSNGAGSVSPPSTGTSPFSFTYTPAAADVGNTVTITLTTDNPNGAPCAAASAIYSLAVNPVPGTPVIGTVTQPTCTEPNGSVELTGLPGSGSWTLTRTPGGITTAGTGTNTVVAGIPQGSYSFTVTNASGCSSGASSSAVINAPPPLPESPSHTVDCSLGSGQAVVTVTSPTGAGFQYSLDGGAYQSNTSFSGVDNGNHSITVRNSSGCTTTGGTFSIDCGCVNGPSVTLNTAGGSTCGTTPTMVSGNIFGGSATSVTITENGFGTVSPSSSSTSPFSFTYTPAVGDAGRTVIITVTTNNPLGPPCEAAIANYTLTVNAPPAIPVIGTITQPTCIAATGSIVVNGLPSSGTWTLTRNPGNITSSGSGPSTTISGLSLGTYTFEVTNEQGCKSGTSAQAVINAQPPAPAAPAQTVDCSLGFGNAVVTVTSPTGAGLEYGLDGGGFQTGTSFSGVDNGTHTITVRNSSGCTTTGPSFSVSCGCVNGPTLSLFNSSGSTCGTSSFTLSGNQFGGSATNVSITENGGGTVSPSTASSSPFSFTYTPAAGDAGNTVTITVTTNNPLGSPCEVATATFALTVNSVPSIPSVGSITQPSCTVATGSVAINGMPSSGTWTLTRDPGGITSSGTGSGTNVTGLPAGSYTFRVSNEQGCTSGSTGTVTINTQPATPPAPSVGTITQPNCSVSTGNVVLNNLPSSGSWTLTRNPGSVTSTGSGATTTVFGLGQGTYSFIVTNASGCISLSSSNVVINAQPPSPNAPIVGTIAQPTCNLSTGSVFLSGLPSSGSWTLTRQPGGVTTTGTGTSRTISGLSADIYSFTVRNSQGCTSPSSSNVIIQSQPVTPSAPQTGTVIQPTCNNATGSVVLNDLPSSGTWTINPGNITGSGPTRTVSGLNPGNYNFTVTNSLGCTSPASSTVTLNTQPVTPTSPVVGTITQPTCEASTGRVFLSGLPVSGTWVLTRNPGGMMTNGSGPSATITGIPPGSYNFTVRNELGCTSGSSTGVVINAQPPSPPSPAQSQDCSLGFGNAVVTVTSPTGAGYTYSLDMGAFQGGTTFSNVANGSHTFMVMNSSGCTTTGPSFSVSCGCVNGPALSLSSNSGITCAISPVTIGNNTFGGSATSVSLQSDGAGTLVPAQAGSNPFSFTYTPSASDAGKTIMITVTTDNPLGSPCAAATEVYTLRVFAEPSPPIPGTITQPSCTKITGEVELTGLPVEGSWNLSRLPDNVTLSGSGSSTLLTGLSPNNYIFYITTENGCSSGPSATVAILSPQDGPSPPVAVDIQPPNCTRSTGIVEMGGLPQTGNWVLTRIQGGVTRSGSGTNITLFSLLEGTYNYTVTDAYGCISDASEDIVIPAQPLTPEPPVVGDITHPNCELPSGSVVLSNLPEDGDWTLTRFPGLITTTGTGGSTTVTDLPSGIFNFLVSNEAGCVSPASSNVVIDVSPDIPTIPVIGEVRQPTCANPYGGIVLTGLPAGNWIITLYPGGITTVGSGVTRLIPGLEPGTYIFTVANSLGCTSFATEEIDIIANPFTPEVLVTDPAPVCVPFTVDLTDALIVSGSTPGLTFSYWVDDAATVPHENPAEAMAGIYFIRGITDEGCVDISPVTVTVLTEPFADAGPDQELNNVLETNLDAMEPMPGETGSWSVMSGTGVFTDPQDSRTFVSGLSVGNNMFLWSVTNDVCPPTGDSVVVRVMDIVVPTLITPNNDGKNDFLVFEGIEMLGKAELTVFDRYGAQVYKNENYMNDWDGVDKEGNPLPDDTYFYVFTSEKGKGVSRFVVVRR